MRNKAIFLATVILLLTSALLLFTGCGHEHEFGEWTVEKEPTCIENGNKIRVCECGEKETEAIEPLGHTDGEWVTDVDATCTEEGSKHQECSICSESLRTETIEAKGHKEIVDEAVAATCTKSGLTRGIHCEICGIAIVKQEEISSLGHNLSKLEAKEATCTETGLTEGSKCIVCNQFIIKQAIIPRKEHIWDNGSCEQYKSCTACGTKSTELGKHNFNKTACIVCGEPNPISKDIAKALKDIERYVFYISNNRDLIVNAYNLYYLTKDYGYFSDVLNDTLDIVDYLRKVVSKCQKYVEYDIILEIMIENCQEHILDAPAGSSNIGDYKLYAEQANRIFVFYDSLCKTYGVK